MMKRRRRRKRWWYITVQKLIEGRKKTEGRMTTILCCL
jgi:hypothetical protein